MTLTIPASPGTCAVLAEHLTGSCQSGFVTSGELDVSWSVGTDFSASADKLTEVTLSAGGADVDPKTLRVSAFGGEHQSVNLTASTRADQRITFGNGSTSYGVDATAADQMTVQIKIACLGDIDLCEGPAFEVHSTGLRALVNGGDVVIGGASGDLVVGEKHEAITPNSKLYLEGEGLVGMGLGVVLDLSPEGYRVGLDRLVVEATDVELDDINITPTIDEADPVLIQVLNDCLAFVGGLLVALLIFLLGRAIPGRQGSA